MTSLTRLSRSPAALSLLAFTACGAARDSHDESGAESSSVPVVAVRLAVVEARPFAIVLAASGAVSSRPGSVATLSAPAPARVARIHVAPGDRVARGDPLVAFERGPFEASFREAEAADRAARQALERAERLEAAGIIPRKEIEQARTTRAGTETALLVARRALELATLRSPLAGVVTRMSATLGASVDANQPLVEVVDPSALEVRLLLSPHDAAEVRAGMPVTFVAGGASTDTVGQGTVSAVSPGLDSASRAVVVRARITRPSRVATIGETVAALIQLGTRAHALVIPISALVPDDAGFRVYVVSGGDVALARPVRVGSRQDGVTEILAGLRAGERVVTEGAYGLSDSSRVSVAGAGAEPGVPKDSAATRAVPR